MAGVGDGAAINFTSSALRSADGGAVRFHARLTTTAVSAASRTASAAAVARARRLGPAHSTPGGSR